MQDNKKEIGLIILSLVFTLLINFLIYNIRIIGQYVFKINFPAFAQPNIARFIAYFLFTIFISTNFRSFKKSVLFIFLPVFLIDSTTLFVGRDLIPLRFPFATLYPLLGIICGTLLRFNRKKFIIAITGALIFMVISNYYIIPKILEYMHVKYNISQSKEVELLDNTFIGSNQNPITLYDTLKFKSSIVEFYFVGCTPCEQKYKYLKSLYDEYSNRGFGLILICDGTANSFVEFKKHWNDNKYKNIIFLYDSSKSLGEYQIEGYPTEFLLKNKTILKKEKGFGLSLATYWLKNERILIDKTLKSE